MYYSEEDSQYKDRPVARAAFQSDYKYDYQKIENPQLIQTPLKPDISNDEATNQPEPADDPPKESSEEPLTFHSIKMTDARQASKKFLPKAGKRRIEEKAAEGQKQQEIVPARKRPENYSLKHPLVKAKANTDSANAKERPQVDEKPRVEELDRDKEYPIIEEKPTVNADDRDKRAVTKEGSGNVSAKAYNANHNSNVDASKLRPSKTMENIIAQSVEEVNHLEDLHFISKYIPHAIEAPIEYEFPEEGKY